MRRKVLSLVLIAVCLINSTVVKAESTTDVFNEDENVTIEDSIYIDGIEFDVDVDIETGNVIISGKTDESDGELIIQPDGEAIIEIEHSDFEDESYYLEIESLDTKDVDVEVFDESGMMVSSYDDYDEIVEDVYEGQAAVSWSLVISAAILLTVAYVTTYVLIKSGVTYIMAHQFYKTISKAKQAVKTKAQNHYYPAYIQNNNVYISPKGISLVSAATIILSDGHIYSLTSSMAKKVINSAGYAAVDSNGVKRSEKHSKSGHIVFYHYHKGKIDRSGKMVKFGSAHSLYGKGVI